MDNPQTGDLNQNAMSADHNALARKLSAAGTVLLKNEGNILPIDTNKVKSIAIIGPDGRTKPMPTGGGSGGVNCPYVVTPFDGIHNRSGAHINVTYNDGSNVNSAVALAKAVDIAIVFGHAISYEGGDRGDLNLQDGDMTFTAAVAAANPNTVVVLHAVGAILMPWVDQAKAIVHAFVPGQEMGNAIADILFGDFNPAGKLPITLPKTPAEVPTNTQRQYPGVNGQMYYDERLEVGHRWYDAHNIEPLFPFGHGLSYTDFSYGQITISGSIPASGGIKVTVPITNTGKLAGAEVAQLYLAFPASAGEPPQVLAGISKVTLNAGQAGTATFALTARQVSTWSIESSSFVQTHGTFGVLVGSSSRDIRAKATFTN